MNYFSDDRAQIGDRPALTWANKPICAIPAISFLPMEHFYLAEVMVMIAPNTARWISTRCDAPGELMEAYVKDPERTLEVRFNWSYTASAVKRPYNSTISITELGDLE